MANPYRDEKGHWTTKENDGGPCMHSDRKHQTRINGGRYQVRLDKDKDWEDVETEEEFNELNETAAEYDPDEVEEAEDFDSKEVYEQLYLYLTENTDVHDFHSAEDIQDWVESSGAFDENVLEAFAESDIYDETWNRIENELAEESFDADDDDYEVLRESSFNKSYNELMAYVEEAAEAEDLEYVRQQAVEANEQGIISDGQLDDIALAIKEQYDSLGLNDEDDQYEGFSPIAKKIEKVYYDIPEEFRIKDSLNNEDVSELTKWLNEQGINASEEDVKDYIRKHTLWDLDSDNEEGFDDLDPEEMYDDMSEEAENIYAQIEGSDRTELENLQAVAEEAWNNGEITNGEMDTITLRIQERERELDELDREEYNSLTDEEKDEKYWFTPDEGKFGEGLSKVQAWCKKHNKNFTETWRAVKNKINEYVDSGALSEEEAIERVLMEFDEDNEDEIDWLEGDTNDGGDKTEQIENMIENAPGLSDKDSLDDYDIAELTDYLNKNGLEVSEDEVRDYIQNYTSWELTGEPQDKELVEENKSTKNQPSFKELSSAVSSVADSDWEDDNWDWEDENGDYKTGYVFGFKTSKERKLAYQKLKEMYPDLEITLSKGRSDDGTYALYVSNNPGEDDVTEEESKQTSNSNPEATNSRRLTDEDRAYIAKSLGLRPENYTDEWYNSLDKDTKALIDALLKHRNKKAKEDAESEKVVNDLLDIDED